MPSPNWAPITMTDEEYEDHPYAKLLDMDKAICPDCKAPTSKGICLNACHLGVVGQSMFGLIMEGIVARQREREKRS